MWSTNHHGGGGRRAVCVPRRASVSAVLHLAAQRPDGERAGGHVGTARARVLRARVPLLARCSGRMGTHQPLVLQPRPGPRAVAGHDPYRACAPRQTKTRNIPPAATAWRPRAGARHDRAKPQHAGPERQYRIAARSVVARGGGMQRGARTMALARGMGRRTLPMGMSAHRSHRSATRDKTRAS
mgnify:CR=1 FL=1